MLVAPTHKQTHLHRNTHTHTHSYSKHVRNATHSCSLSSLALALFEKYIDRRIFIHDTITIRINDLRARSHPWGRERFVADLLVVVVVVFVGVVCAMAARRRRLRLLLMLKKIQENIILVYEMNARPQSEDAQSN